MRKGLMLGLLLSATLLAVLFAPPTYGQTGRGSRGLETAIAAQERHTDHVLGIQGVVGTAVGLGKNGQPVVKIYTNAAGIAKLPKKLDGIPVEVKVTGDIVAFDHNSKHKGTRGGKSSNEAPVVEITNPTDGDSFVDGETVPIAFEATASDAEDAGLTCGDLSWNSNRDAAIGNGCSFSTTLSAGTHTITASITDSGDKTGTDSISITVGNVVDTTSRFIRPVPIGVSSGNVELYENKGRFYCSVGTLGTRLLDHVNNVYYALSNNHVYAHEGRASIGDVIVQPGTVDIDPVCSDNSGSDSIGTLAAFVPIEFSRFASNVADAAIAETTAADVGNSTPSDGYGVPGSTTLPANQSLGVNVQKYGRTTSLTKGTVTGINASIIIRYDSGRARFDNQLVIEGGGFSSGGDSGAIIVVDGGPDDLKPVGLLFAGGSSTTIASPIDLVLSELALLLGIDASNLTID